MSASSRRWRRSSGSEIGPAGEVVDRDEALAQTGLQRRRRGRAGRTGRRPPRRFRRAVRCRWARGARSAERDDRARRPAGARRRPRTGSTSRRARWPARGARSSVRLVTTSRAPRRCVASAASRPIRPAPATTIDLALEGTDAPPRSGRARDPRASEADRRTRCGPAGPRGGPTGRAARAPGRAAARLSGAIVSRSWWRIWSSPMTALSSPHADRDEMPGRLDVLEPTAAGREIRQTARRTRRARRRARRDDRCGRRSRRDSAAARRVRRANASRRALGTQRACATSATTVAERWTRLSGRTRRPGRPGGTHADQRTGLMNAPPDPGGTGFATPYPCRRDPSFFWNSLASCQIRSNSPSAPSAGRVPEGTCLSGPLARRSA